MAEWKRQVGDETIIRTCAYSPPGCHPVGCGLLVHVKDGVVTRVEGDPEHPITKGALCPRCLALKEFIYHPDRLKYPMRRKREDRGKDTWERCSWDEAIDLIADNANRIIDEYGPEAICVFGGTGREANDYYPMWANLVFGTPNAVYAQAGWSCYGPRMSATGFTMGVTYPEIDYAQKFADRYDHPGWKAPEVIVLWGKEPLRSNPDGLFGHAIIEMMQRFGTKIICVDPRVRWIGTRAEYLLQVQPGTDVALAMAWLYVLTTEDLVDHEFIDNWCYGYDELCERVKEMPPSRAAEICGVPEEDIWASARMYGNAHPSSIGWGLAVDENTNGTQLGMALLDLMAITGELDAPGGTIMGAFGIDDQMAACAGGSGNEADKKDINVEGNDSALGLAVRNGIMEADAFDVKRIGVQKYPVLGAYMWTVMPDEFLKTLETGEPYGIHMALFSSSNPVGTAIAAEPQRWYNALKNLDFNFATELFMNPTVMSCCDLVLPLATTIEHDGLVITHYGLNTSFYGAQNECVQVGECKHDTQMIVEVGKRIHPEFWNQFNDYHDYMDRFVMRPWLPWEQLRDNVVTMSEDDYYKYKTGGLRTDGQPGFNTPTGKVELSVTSYAEMGVDPLPYYEPIAYGPDSTPELMEKYPFLLTTGSRQQVFFHSEHKQIKSLRSVCPYPLVDINPSDAEAYGIEDGDWVEMASPYGKARQKAHITPTIKPGVVHAMHGFWYPEQEGAEPNLFGNWKSNINMLMPNSVNAWSGFGNTFKSMICSIKKVDGLDGMEAPTEDNVRVEPSRRGEFAPFQEWRPATAPDTLS